MSAHAAFSLLKDPGFRYWVRGHAASRLSKDLMKGHPKIIAALVGRLNEDDVYDSLLNQDFCDWVKDQPVMMAALVNRVSARDAAALLKDVDFLSLFVMGRAKGVQRILSMRLKCSTITMLGFFVVLPFIAYFSFFSDPDEKLL